MFVCDEAMYDKRESNIVNSSKNRYYYSVLNIPRDADSAHIQRNYKLLSRIYHPDKATATGIVSHYNDNNNNRDVAQQSFVIIKSAVDVLCDPVYRFVYDYGDEIAVTLVKRSQSARHSEQHQHSDSSNENGNDNKSQNRHDHTRNGHRYYRDHDNDDDDLYTILQNKIRQSQDEEAMSILDEVLENYYTQQKNLSNNTHASKFDLSCSIPMSWKEADRYYYNAPPPSRLHKESISLNAQGRYPVTSHFGISLGTGSEVHHQQLQHQQQQHQRVDNRGNNNNNNNNNTSQSNKNNIKGSIGFDFQPVAMPGTSVHGNITTNPNRITAPDISISTSRKCSNDSVVVAAIHGNVRNSKSWYTSFISSKPILYESLFGKSWGRANTGRNDRKLMMNWRIICDMMGRLRGFMMSLRNMEYPMWTGRLSLSNYPIKLSWCGSETDTFYVAVSLGPLDWPRIKVVRISSFGSADRDDHQWKIKYGLKHDPQQAMLYSGSSLWSIVCTIQYANEFTLRLPIRLLESSSTPVAWMGSVLVAEFVDQQLKQVQWNEDSRNDVDFLPPLHSTSSKEYHCLPKEALEAFRKVASKKRADESNKPDGLVILQANLTFHNGATMVDVTDTLQFWVVNSQLNMSLSDVRLLWQVVVDDDITFEKEVVTRAETDWWRQWWNVLCHDDHEPSQYENVLARISQLDVRYQYQGMTYQVAFDASVAVEEKTANHDDTLNRINIERPNVIRLPNINAIELGPSNRVR